MPFEYLIQGVGILGFFIGVSAFLCKTDQLLKFFIGVASCLVATHFMLIGAYVGAGAASFTAIRSFLSIFQKVKPFAPLFFMAYIPLGYFYIHDWIDILPLIAGVIGTYSMFYLERIPMRYGLMLTSSVWLIHNILQGSIGPSLLEIFYISANAKTIFDIKKDDQENGENTTFRQ